MIPGSNLLGLANTIISPLKVQYEKFIDKTTNSLGLDVDNFAPAIDIIGNFQPVPREKYEHLGLDFESNYAMWYGQTFMGTVTRGDTGDKITFAGELYSAIGDNDWIAVDGWSGVMFIEIKEPVAP